MIRAVDAANAEIESIKAAVARHFPVYGIVVTPLALTFQVSAPEERLDASFDGLRRELVPRHYIPSITKERGETLIHVQRRPTPRFTRGRVNLAFLIATILTTVFFGGAYNWAAYASATGREVPILSGEAIALGTLTFALPLLTILGSHEMGHYVVARRYRVQASLPFFLPSVPPLGTFGAFISMRDPIPSRRALLDIGVSGPLVGLAVAIPVALLGIQLSVQNGVLADPGQAGQALQASLLFDFLSFFIPLPETLVLHPTAFAGWVGFFVTAINLLPAGQLDGGHVARALLGNRQHYVSWAAVIILFSLGVFYPGWIIFGFLILVLGVRHPPPLNDLTRLSAGRKLVGIAAVAVLVLTFIPQPFVQVPAATPSIAFEDPSDGTILGNLTANVTAGNTTILAFAVNNTGIVRAEVSLLIDPRNLDALGFGLEFVDYAIGTNTTIVSANATQFILNRSELAIVRLRIAAPSGLSPTTLEFLVRGVVEGNGTTELLVFLNVI